MEKKRRILIPAILILLALLGTIGYIVLRTMHPKHTYGEWKLVKQATCEEPGIEERACSCGKTEQKEILAIGHKEVVDEAVEATCTKEGLTKGSHCANCQAVFQEQKVIPAAHDEEVIHGIAPTCTRAGKMNGATCATCGELVVRQKKIRHLGHNYSNGICARCKQTQPDTAAAILIDQLNEEGTANFITKKAYKGGSTITFQAYVPEGVSWWAVSWTKDASDIGLYEWAEGKGSEMKITPGTWQMCTVTLPDDDDSYYIYFVGAKGEWKGLELLIDDVTITSASGNELGSDDFNNGLDDGLFRIVSVNPSNNKPVVYLKEVCTAHQEVIDRAKKATCTEEGLTIGSHCKACGKVIIVQQAVSPKGHKWLNDRCERCGTKKVNLAAAIRIDQLNEEAPMNFITKKAYPAGSTVSFKAYVPEGVTWWAVSWTTDPKKAGLYEWAKGAAYGSGMTSTVGEWAEYTATLPDDGNKYYIYFVGEKGQWAGKELLIDALTVSNKNGKIIAEESFDDGLYNGLFDVIDTNPTTGESVVGERSAEDPCKNGHTIVNDPAVAPTCTETGKTRGTHCSVCLKVIQPQKEVPAVGHQYGKNGTCKVCGAKLKNRAVGIYIDQINENGNMNFITREKYAGGSTISLRAYVPSDVAWWAIQYTTDLDDVGLYKWAEEGLGASQPSTPDAWKEYTLTLPDDGKEYYIYIVGAKGEWKDKKLLIDDVKITDKSGNSLAEDDFNSGIKSGIFQIVDQNPTTGKEAVCEVVVGNVCKHTKVAQEASKDATCTEDGLIGRTYCKDCDVTISEAVVIPATGHNYENAECTVCGDKMKDLAIGITIDQLNEYSDMNVITREAYPGGSTVSLRAYVPAGVSWWAIQYTTDVTDVGLYKWNEEGLGASQPSAEDAWKDYSITLPDDGKEYYIYIVGAKGEWNNQELLVDDVKITDKSGSLLVEDDFNQGIANSIFQIVEQSSSNTEIVVHEVVIGDICLHTNLEQEANKDATCTEDGLQGRSYCKDCGRTMQEAIVIPATGHNYVNNECTACGEKQENKVVALHMKYIREDGKSLVTKNTYPGGSKITFKALVPVTEQWWGVGYYAEGSNGDIYSIAAKNLNDDAKVGTWNEYTVTLPDDGQNYYIFFGGGKDDPWINNPLLIDDFVITDAAGANVLASDNFNEGFADVFEVTALDGNNTVVELQTVVEKQTNTVAALHMKYIREDGKSLVTKNAYPGGSTVTFKAMAPITEQWWGVGYYAEGSSTDIYSIAANSLNDDAKVGTWNEYSVTLPDDDKNYYIFFGGGKDDPWINNPLLIDDVVVKDASGTPIAEDDFEAGLTEGIFNAITMDGSNTVVETKVLEAEEPEEPEVPEEPEEPETPEEPEGQNTVAALHMKYIKEDGTSLKSKQAYPGGSTVTFKAMVPITEQWWGLGYVAVGKTTDIYSIASGKNLNDDAKVGTWNEYTVTLPDDDQDYYIFFGGGKDNPWINNPLLIDDVVVKDAYGTPIAEDDFEAGLTAGIFDAITMDGSNTVVETKVLEVEEPEEPNTVVAIHMKYIKEDGTSLKSKQAYPGGSTVTFKAMAPIIGQWWGLGYVAEGSTTDIYSIASGKNLNDDAKVGTWNEYSVTLPDDGQNYYIFFGGGKDDPWINNPLLIDDVVVKNASGTPIAEDDFEAGLTAGIFNAITEDGGNTVIATITE